MTKRTDGPSAQAKIRVMKRDRFRCSYCGNPGTDFELEIDHIIPVAKGGSHHISNLTTACMVCNREKSDKAAPSFAPPQVSGLLHMFVHILENGKIEQQGHVIGLDADMAFVELFSWLDGYPTVVKAIPRNTLLSDNARLYSAADLMISAYEREQLRHGV